MRACLLQDPCDLGKAARPGMLQGGRAMPVGQRDIDTRLDQCLDRCGVIAAAVAEYDRL